ncbi:MAG: hypothetical protein ABIW85_01640 [Variovorax sp.]
MTYAHASMLLSIRAEKAVMATSSRKRRYLRATADVVSRYGDHIMSVAVTVGLCAFTLNVGAELPEQRIQTQARMTQAPVQLDQGACGSQCGQREGAAQPVNIQPVIEKLPAINWGQFDAPTSTLAAPVAT